MIPPWIAGPMLSAAVAWPLLRLVERSGAKLGLMDWPNERSSHGRPTPRGGGVAIVIGTFAGLLLYAALGGTAFTRPFLAYLASALLVAGVSLADDLRPMSPLLRLATHVVAAGILLLSCGPVTSLSLPGGRVLALGGLGWVVGGVWLVGLTNVYNFMDGIDGLAGGQAVIAGAAWSVLGDLAGNPLVTGLGLSLGASSLLFLTRNWSPARLFMGDAGSAFLGYTFAAFPLLVAGASPGSAGPSSGAALVQGALIVWPFLFDSTLTLVRRAHRGEPLLRPHRGHLYQRLVSGGWSQARVSAVYLLLGVVGAMSALAWTQASAPLSWLITLAPLALGGALWGNVLHREREPARLPEP